MENNFRFASAAVSDRGLSDKRPVNEDSYVEAPAYGLFAVADGVGGAQAGDFASQMAVEILAEAFANLPENVDAETAMKEAVESANQGIFNASSELPQLSSMATTVAALHVSGNIATIAHVGDSRVYRIEPDGTLHRETIDHSVVEEEVRAGRITPEQALTHPNRNVISRALGAESTVDVDLKTIMVEPGTMFLLCSDGITRHVDDAELTKTFGYEIEPAVICDKLKDLCYQRGAEDNLTAVVVRIASELAGSFAPNTVGTNGIETVEELEEETVATARTAYEPAEPDADAPVLEVPVSTEPPHEDLSNLANELDDESYLLEEPQGVEPASSPENYTSESVLVKAPEPEPLERFEPPVEASSGSASFQSFEVADPPRSRFPITSLLFLVLGVALGAAGYYFWQTLNPAPEVPVLNQQQSNDIPLSSFEEGRRLVDADPSRYLAAKAATPEGAEDHYLLGRALLLSGKYVEAQRQFQLARQGLDAVDASNRKTIGYEIALADAIASDPARAEAFAKSIAANPSGPAGGSANTNTNTNAANAATNRTGGSKVPPLVN